MNEMFKVITLHISGPGSSVGIASGYGPDGQGIKSWWGRGFRHLSRLAHPSSYTMGNGSLPGVESSQGVMLTPHPLLVLMSKNRVGLYLYLPKGLRGL
jgi:hypothetical protein